jgi:hypothetical protein
VRPILPTVLLVCANLPAASPAAAQGASDAPAVRPVYLDDAGVIRWRDSKQEVALSFAGGGT